MYMSALVMLSCCLHVFRACGYVCLCDVFDTLYLCLYLCFQADTHLLKGIKNVTYFF